ncbi:MAG: DUF2269 family protein [Chloroflexi bacterium]|nr:DUF2269 family protein [Chloroflexota bacterium]
MTTYEVLLFLHILGVFFLVGAAGVSNAVGFMLPRVSAARTALALLDLQHRVEWFVTLPAAVAIAVFGTLLVGEAGYGYGDAWIGGAYALIVFMLALDHGLLMPANRRMRRRVVALAEGPDVAELRAATTSAPANVAGALLDFSLLAVLFLMVVKPGS